MTEPQTDQAAEPQAATTDPHVVSLDEFRAAATRKHGDLRIPLDDSTTVILQRPMRLSREKRNDLAAAEQRMRAAREEHDEVKRARREHKAAQDRLAILDPENTSKRVVLEHERRVADAEQALEDKAREHERDEVEQLDELLGAVRDQVRAIADTPAGAEALLEAVGDDFYVMQGILERWRGQVEPAGEATPSQS